MDGARPASVYTAMTKAVTAATFRQETGPLPLKGEPDLLLNLSLQNAASASGGKVTTLKGGIPVIVDGQVIGGLGVGGGSGEQDAEVAKAGLQTLTLVTLVFSGQAIFYVVRERRRLWASRPSSMVVAASVADLILIPSLAVSGTLMAPIPLSVAAAICAASILLALVLDTIKVGLFGWLKMV
jgi:hypothetical protein